MRVAEARAGTARVNWRRASRWAVKGAESVEGVEVEAEGGWSRSETNSLGLPAGCGAGWAVRGSGGCERKRSAAARMRSWSMTATSGREVGSVRAVWAGRRWEAARAVAAEQKWRRERGMEWRSGKGSTVRRGLRERGWAIRFWAAWWVG